MQLQGYIVHYITQFNPSLIKIILKIPTPYKKNEKMYALVFLGVVKDTTTL